MAKKALTLKTEQDLKYSKYKEFDENDKDKFYIFKVYDLIKKLTSQDNIKKVLDVGCADGSFAKKLKIDFDLDAYGVDISKEAIKLANKNGVNAKVHDMENELPFPDDYFDLVFACELIEHVYDTDFVISEFKRVLKKNGSLILTTPNLASFPNRMRLLLGKYPLFVPEYNVSKDTAGHIRAYTLPVLVNQLEKHGLRVVINSSPNITFPMVNKHIPYFLKKIAIKLGDIFPKIGSHMIVVSKK